MSKVSPETGLFPPIEPFETGHLDASGGHRVYYEVSGNPKGAPALVVHGGPGAPPNDDIRQYFHPGIYKIVVFHQRGCGKSTPFGEVAGNTTKELLLDMEMLRKRLHIEKWLLFGGSWGTTLALAYAIQYPTHVSAMVLRGTFLCREKDIKWLYEFGANQLFPDSWNRFVSVVSEDLRDDLVRAYQKLLHDDDENTQVAAANAWSAWEGSMISIGADGHASGDFADPAYAIAFARLCCHYLGNQGFLGDDNYILDHASKLEHIPTALVTGRYDAITPSMWANELYAHLQSNPDSTFEIVTNASHSACDDAMRDALIRATSRIATLLSG